MSFFDDAQRVFETAALGDGPAALGILVDDAGAVRIVDSAGWRPEALQVHYGSRAVFQVTRGAGSVRVAARSGSRSCTLESESAAASVLRAFDHLGRAGRLLDLPGQALL